MALEVEECKTAHERDFCFSFSSIHTGLNKSWALHSGSLPLKIDYLRKYITGVIYQILSAIAIFVQPVQSESMLFSFLLFLEYQCGLNEGYSSDELMNHTKTMDTYRSIKLGQQSLTWTSSRSMRNYISDPHFCIKFNHKATVVCGGRAGSGF